MAGVKGVVEINAGQDREDVGLQEGNEQFEAGQRRGHGQRQQRTGGADGTERIDILGQTIDTLRVHEDIDVPEWAWSARNTWWLSRESRLAWRSTQHLTPDQPPLHLEMLKRPA